MNLEKLYSEFQEKVLPLAAQGIQVTKEYFTDLFGRYVQYLFIYDVINAVALLVLTSAMAALAIVFLRRGIADHEEYGDGFPWFMSCGISATICLIFFLGLIGSAMDAVKTATVPEIRVFEEIARMKK